MPMIIKESEVNMSMKESASCQAFRKTAHPHNAEDGQGWEKTEVADTLNIYDNAESRSPVLVIENHPADSRVRISKDGIFQTLNSRMGTGGGNVPMVMYAVEDDITPKIDGNGKAFSLRAREHKSVQVVVMEMKK